MTYPNKHILKSILKDLIDNSPINEDLPYLRKSIEVYGQDVVQKHLLILSQDGHIDVEVTSCAEGKTVYTRAITQSGREYYNSLSDPVLSFVSQNKWNIMTVVIAIVAIIATFFV
jgi:hypothetical protein